MSGCDDFVVEFVVHFMKPFDPGEYPGVLDYPDGPVPAEIDLKPNHAPTFRAHKDPSHATPRQRVPYRNLRGRLRNHHAIFLKDAEVQEWPGGDEFGSARWALVGLPAIGTSAWDRVAVHVSGVEGLLPAPVSEPHWPQYESEGPQQLSAVMKLRPVPESACEGTSVCPQFEISPSVGGLYGYSVSTHAMIRFRSEVPIEVDDWLADWIHPLVTLVGIATGRREHVQLVTVEKAPASQLKVPLDDPSDAGIRATLFESGIGQDLTPAEQPLDNRGRRVAPLFTFDTSPPLAGLIAASRTATDSPAFPLLSFSQDPDLHPAVRLVLLATAAESLHRASGDEDEDEEFANRKAEFKNVRARVKAAGLADDFKFLRDKVETSRPFPLADRIRELLQTPALSPRMLGGFERRTFRLDGELRALGREPTDLADRFAHARNVLSHGAAELSESAVTPAMLIMDLVVRVAVLERLGFAGADLHAAADSLWRGLPVTN